MESYFISEDEAEIKSGGGREIMASGPHEAVEKYYIIEGNYGYAVFVRIPNGEIQEH